MKCPVYKKCSGCQLHNLSYEEQLEFKQNTAQKLLSKFGKVEQIKGMYYPYNYRNKAQARFITARNGKIISGIYQSTTNGIVSTDNCLIEDKKSDEIIVSIRELMKKLKITTFDETTGTGFLRHVLVRRAFKTGEIMVVLAAFTPVFPHKNDFVRLLLQTHPQIKTIVLNIADGKENLVLGDREIILHGDGYIEDVLCGHRFRISSKSFYQINPQQTEVLYKKAIEYAGLTGKEIVVDAYCGIGTIGLIAADKAHNVIAVELNKQAVKDAIVNAKINKAKNIRFYNEDAGEFMVKMAQEGMRADVLFMDPPRAGASVEFLKSALKLSASRIVYISCNPQTQARDLEILVKGGYKVEMIQPVDMFPHTKHVETVVLLSHKEVETTIDVKMEFGEGEGKYSLKKIQAKAEKFKPKEKVTYKMIQEYVENKYGFKVHTAYISEVKRSLGLDMYDAPNAVETLKNPRKHPTSEKVEAIKDALKHFEII